MKKSCLIPLLQILCMTLVLQGCAANRADAAGRDKKASYGSLDQACMDAGWRKVTFKAAGVDRKLLWKAPPGAWAKGAILVLHGGGGEAAHFCAGGRLVKPQIAFADLALSRGFAVFALDSTNDVVTDAEGRTCGKRFDFSVLSRNNVDLPYIQHIINEVVPGERPKGSNPSIFMTGLSTGGYMTIRASTVFGNKLTAFAPVSAGDPYGTETICDTSRSKRTSAKGVLVDRETRKEIVKDAACEWNGDYRKEARWAIASGRKPPVRQFHNEKDGIVDMSCMRKVTRLLRLKGYPVREPFIAKSWGRRNAFRHLWLKDYNKPILDFFETQGGG